MANAHVLLESIFNTACTIEEAAGGKKGRSTFFTNAGRKADKAVNFLNKKVTAIGSGIKSGASYVGGKLRTGASAVGGHLSANKAPYISGLLGAGLGAAGGYTLSDKLDDTGEHIDSLRNKLAGMIAADED